jgi:hypothetical protein
MTLLPSRWYGTTFNVQYSTDPSQKNSIKAHLLTSRDSFELISLDWKTSLDTFSAIEIDRIETKKTTVTLTMKPPCKTSQIHLNTAPDPCDRLAEALCPSGSSAKSEPNYLSFVSIIPSIRGGAQVQRAAIELAGQLLHFFGPVQTNSAVLVDAVVCAFRARVSNENGRTVEQSMEALGQEIKRLLIVRWAKATDHFHVGEGAPSVIHFQLKMAQAISSMVRKVASNLGIACHELDQAIQSPSFPAGIEVPIRKLGKVAQEAIEREEQAVRYFDMVSGRVLQSAVLVVIGAMVVGMYELDLRMYDEAIVEYGQAVVDRTAVHQAVRTFQGKQGVFLRDLLCFLDGRRFDEIFQWIYCLWELKAGEGS